MTRRTGEIIDNELKLILLVCSLIVKLARIYHICYKIVQRRQFSAIKGGGRRSLCILVGARVDSREGRVS